MKVELLTSTVSKLMVILDNIENRFYTVSFAGCPLDDVTKRPRKKFEEVMLEGLPHIFEIL